MHDNDPEVRPLLLSAPEAERNSSIADAGTRETKKLVRHPP